MKARFICVVVTILLLMVVSFPAFAANPPICPHVIGWNSQIGTWAQGAPWIKVIYSSDIVPAQNAGAKVFYRPYEADSVDHDDGNLPSGQTGSQYADLVWARISGLTTKPTAVGYRNEFNWDNPTASKRTCAEFVNYKNRLRTLGYAGKIIFGSFGVGWVDSQYWDDVDCRAATDAADGIETHEYFDLTVACCSPWLCFRHRDIAIADHPDHLGNKEWYIGEFGSDRVCGNCTDCDDNSCRRGWRDNGKLTEQAFINQLSAYRSGCANQVVAVFLFQQGSGSWSDFDVMGTTVATWMQGTWTGSTGAIAGTVKDSSNVAISGATVSTTTGGYTTTTNSSGAYTLSNVATGTYSVVASKAGYNSSTQTGKTVTAGATTTVSFTLTASGGTGAIAGNVKNRDGVNTSGATVSTTTGGYTTTTNSSGNYTLSSVAVGTYSVVAAKSGFVSQTQTGKTVSAGATTTVNFADLYIVAQAFDSVPSWTSSFDATWGTAATWSSVSGGQSGNCLQASRSSQGSSAKVIRYSVPTNTSVTISLYIKCPSNSCTYWIESAFKLGDYSASDFDANSATWTYIQKFSNTGTNGNGNVWTKYSATVNTGANTQISVGYKHGASGCAGPAAQWDTFLLD